MNVVNKNGKYDCVEKGKTIKISAHRNDDNEPPPWLGHKGDIEYVANRCALGETQGETICYAK